MMDLVLVNPSHRTSLYGEMASEFSAIEPLFWAGLVASFIRQHGYEVMILDADAEGLSHSQAVEQVVATQPELVAIIVQGANPSASSTPKMTATAGFCQALKILEPNIKILLGGTHPSALPERTLNESGADFVCVGEMMWATLELLGTLKSHSPRLSIDGLWYRKGNSIIDNGRAVLLGDEQLPPVAWDLLDMTRYRAHNWHCLDRLDQRSPYAVIYTSLGCPYDCSFCTIHSYFAGKPSIRFRPMDSVIEEIDLLVNKYNVKNIKIMDELFTLKEDRVNQFCDAIIKRGYHLNMWAYARVNTGSERLFAKMKQAGINWIGYGFETGIDKMRSKLGKDWNLNEMDRAIKISRDAGLYHMPSFMFGLPDDSMVTMQTTLDVAEHYNFEYVNFYCAVAYPGARLYEDAIKQGIDLPDSWEAYGQLHPNFKPLPTRYLTSDQVLDFRDKAFQHYFSRSEYLGMVKDKLGSRATEHIKRMLQGRVR